MASIREARMPCGDELRRILVLVALPLISACAEAPSVELWVHDPWQIALETSQKNTLLAAFVRQVDGHEEARDDDGFPHAFRYGHFCFQRDGGLVVRAGTVTIEDGVVRVRAPVLRRTQGRRGWRDAPAGAIIFATPLANVARLATHAWPEGDESSSSCL